MPCGVRNCLSKAMLVPPKHRFSEADLAVAVSHRGRDVGDLVAARLPPARRPAELPEGFEEEGLDVVRL